MKILSLILIMFIGTSWARGADIPDNIRVTDEFTSFQLIARDGKPWQVKIEKKQTYEALRSDDNTIATTFYDDDTSIDKASAPGSKPIYRQWTDDDIFYDDSRICALPLELKKGKPVKVEFKSTMKKPEQFNKISLTCGEFTLKSTTQVTIPAELASTITIEARNLTDNMHITKAVSPKGDVTYTVEAHDIKPYKREDYGTQLISSPALLVKGMFANVSDLYSYLRGFLPDYSTVAPEVNELAHKVTQGATGEIAKIDSIAAWVRDNIRYVAIEHGDYAFSPAAPAEVLKCRYGDCKGSASLLKSMMQAVGIDGRVVWIGTSGHSNLTWEEHPARTTGNHMIAAAVVGDSIIYIDGTIGNSPAGHIPAGIRGQQALIEDGEGYLLRTVPTPPAAESEYNIAQTASIIDNTLCGTTRHSLTGDYKALVSQIYGSAPVNRREKYINTILTGGNANIRTDNIKYNGDSINAEFVNSEAIQAVGNSLYVKLSPIHTIFCSNFDTEDRCSDAAFKHIENATSDMHLALSDGMKVKSLPEPFVVDNEWFDAAIEFSCAEDNTVTCRSHLRMKQTKVPVDKVKQWNDALKSILKASDSRIVIEKTI